MSESGNWHHALALLNVAIQALRGTKLQHLRQRAACLAQLGLHERAVSDLSRVILREEEAKLRAEDLCRRGRSLLLCSRDEAAVEDFTLALELHTDQALMYLEGGPERDYLAEVFLRFAVQNYGEKRLDKAWSLTECGLKVDTNHAELRRLKARMNREVSGSCSVH